jgi:hypothetical protein
MEGRNLRVMKWLAMVPVVGVCTSCNMEFKVPLDSLKRVADAQQSLRAQFNGHAAKTSQIPRTERTMDEGRDNGWNPWAGGLAVDHSLEYDDGE